MADIYYNKNVKTNYNISLNEFKVLAEHADFSILRKWSKIKGSYELSNKLCNIVYAIYIQLHDFLHRKEWFQVAATKLDSKCHYIRSASIKYKMA